jgi:hypothetical protein
MRSNLPQVQLLDSETPIETALSTLTPEQFKKKIHKEPHSVIIMYDEVFFINRRQTSLDAVQKLGIAYCFHRLLI